MKAQVLIGRVIDVQPHPENDVLNKPLDVVTLTAGDRQYTNVADRPSPDETRYKVGDYAAMLVENSIIPKELMRHLGLWDEAKKQGMLGGKNKDRLRPRSMGKDTKITSEVALCPTWWTRLPDREIAGAKYQEGVLHFSPELLDNWPQDWVQQTPSRIITKGTLADGTVTIVRNDFMVPWKPAEVGEPSDDFTPTGEDVAWNLGVEEIYEVKDS